MSSGTPGAVRKCSAARPAHRHLRADAFYWSFYQDGTIEYQIKLTGELSTNALSAHEMEMGKVQTPTNCL